MSDQEDRSLGALRADLREHDREIIQVFVEALDVAAPARGSPVSAVIVGMRGEAARREPLTDVVAFLDEQLEKTGARA